MSWQPLGIRAGGGPGEPFKGTQLESHLLLVPAVEKGPQQRESVVMGGGKGVAAQSRPLAPGFREEGDRPGLFFSALITY